jgi:hypothetical protein
MSSETILLESSLHYSQFRKIEMTRSTNVNATIICGDTKISVDKHLFSASSDYFFEAFKATNEINLSHLDVQAIFNIRDFIYISSLKIKVTEVSQFFDCAKKLSIKGLPKYETDSSTVATAGVENIAE